MELTGIQAVDADVQGRQPRIEPLAGTLLEPIPVGGHGHLLDAGSIGHGLDDGREVAAQGGLASSQTHLARPHGRKPGDDATDLLQGEEGLAPLTISFRRVIAVRQTVGTAEIADVGDRQTQIVKATGKTIFKWQHKHLSKYGRPGHFFPDPFSSNIG